MVGLDDLIAEVISIYGNSDLKLSRQTRGGGATAGFRGGRGKPGYPVPQIIAPEERPELQDEAVQLPDKVEHLEDLSPDAFMQWLEKYRSLPLDGKLEVSEKVDGSARMTFGVQDGKVWTQSKHGARRLDPSQYPDKPAFKAIRMAHAALKSKEKEIVSWWDVSKKFENDFVVGAEVLYTKIPNSIEYGPNVIMIHGILTHGGMRGPAEEKKIADDLIAVVGSKLSDGKDEWLFEYKRTVDPKDLMVDVKVEYDNLTDLYRDLKKFEPDRRKNVGKEAYQFILTNFRATQLAVKKKLLGPLKKQSPAYGPKGGDVEGLIFRDLESGTMTKLVDREYFSQLNKFLWRYRELLSRGAMVGDTWEHGVASKLWSAVGNVVGKNIKTPHFRRYIQSMASVANYPAGADSAEKKLDILLAKYVRENDLLSGDFIGEFRQAVAAAQKNEQKLRDQWDKIKNGEINFTAPDGRVRKMDKLIKDRTDDAFDQMHGYLAELTSAIDQLEKVSEGMTRRVAALKLVIGENGLEKLRQNVDQKLDESASPGTTLGSSRAGAMRGTIVKNSDLLKSKKSIDPTKLKILGSGAHGIAFDMGEGKVLKVTDDPSEASTSNHLNGNTSTKHIARIYDVFRFRDSKLYGIVQEKLVPLPTSDAAELTRAYAVMDKLNGAAALYMFGEDWKAFTSKIRMGIGASDSNKLAQVLDTFKKFSIDKILDEAHALGVSLGDLHAGNIMKRGNECVAVDFGVSDSPGALPPVLEKIIKRVVESVAEKDDLGFGFNEDGYPLQDKYEFQGMPLSIENKKGSTRHWYDDDGKEKGSVKMRCDYGYIEGAKGSDGEDVDVYVGPDESAEFAYVVHQNKAPDFEKYDEDKVMLGFSSEEDAREAYLKQYNDDRFYGGMSSMPIESFKEKLGTGKITNESFIREALPGAIKRVLGKFAGKKSTPIQPVKTASAVKGGTGKPDERGVPPEEAAKIFEQFQEQLKKKGIDVLRAKPIGKGTWGTAYDLGSGKVLKVTRDKTEAVASLKLKDKAFHHVVRVYDVWNFKGLDVYGIILEKLSPLPIEQGKVINAALFDTHILNALLKRAGDWEAGVALSLEWCKEDAEAKPDEIDPDSSTRKMTFREKLAQHPQNIKTLEDSHLNEMARELKSIGVLFADYHAGNIMLRGNDPVVLDIGQSKITGGQEPPVLEGKTRSAQRASLDVSQVVSEEIRGLVDGVVKGLTETRADTIGLTIGRFQPFHKGHAEIIRRLAKEYTKVVVLVAGNGQDSKNPFSFDLRVEMMHRSLPDVGSKVEIHRAEAGGKATGFIPEIVSQMVRDGNSSIKAGSAINILVGRDRFPEIKGQLDRARSYISGGGDLEFDPDLAVVKQIADVQSDDDAGRVSGTKLREALARDDKESVRSMMDSHMISNPSDFEKIYQRLRDEMPKVGPQKLGELDQVIEDVLHEASPGVNMMGPSSTQVGMKAGSSAWSSPSQYTEDEVEAAGFDEFEPWQNKLLPILNPKHNKTT